MDSLIAAAGRALSAGDALGALKRVALRDDPPALALRGIAMAQLGEHLLARALLRRAARGFSPHEELARARCIVAEAEAALAMRDLRGSIRPLALAASTLEARADRANALHARLIATRRLLLLGRIEEARAALTQLDARGMPSSLQAIAELTAAELELRSLRAGPAQAALARAQDALARAHAAAYRAGVPALLAEVAGVRAALDRPAARRLADGGEETLRLHQVAALYDSGALVIDACSRGLRCASVWKPLAKRPVLFALARSLGQAWPGELERHALILHAFGTRRPNESHRARLRVEIGRLRKLISSLARIDATARGFVLRPRGDGAVVLAPPIDGDQGSLAALLSDGEAWSTSALALALGASQRTVQRSLAELEAAQRVRSIGRARARRWLSPPLSGFTTILLLPDALPFQ
jgi:hypothetical protein